MKVESPAQRLLYTTVLIEAQFGDDVGWGTAFIFERKTEEPSFYMVTNKHVVAGASTGRFFFTASAGGEKATPDIGNRVDVELDDFEARWTGHPDPAVDVAVMPLAPILRQIQMEDRSVFFRALSEDSIPSTEDLANVDASEELLFAGYPIALYDSVNLLPILRRGTIATPVQVDYDGKPIFLMDASIFGESSGSPVVLFDPGFYGPVLIASNARDWFLGIVAEVFKFTQEGPIRRVSVPMRQQVVAEIDQYIDIGVVFKARTILETIELVEQSAMS